MIITVVICTHNRARLLIESIDSIYKAIIPSDCTLKIIVVANACSDNTIPLLNNHISTAITPHISTIVLNEPIPGKSHALNHAINFIDQGFICFVDDDQRVDQNYFKAVYEAISEYPDVSFFCGPILPDWTGSEPAWVHEQGKYKIYPEPISNFYLGLTPLNITHDTTLPGGGTLIVKKEVFNKIGNFSTKLGPTGHNLAGGEDSDFVLRALKANETILYIPTIIQYHYVDPERLKLNFLILTSFKRTHSFILVNNPKRQAIPLYMWRKLFNYFLSLITCFNINKFRFYSIRIAATLGEILGLKDTITKS